MSGWTSQQVMIMASEAQGAVRRAREQRQREERDREYIWVRIRNAIAAANARYAECFATVTRDVELGIITPSRKRERVESLIANETRRRLLEELDEETPYVEPDEKEKEKK